MTYESGIRPFIDDYLITLSKEKRDYGKYWSASSAGYCMRKNIFDRLGVPQVKEDPRLQRVFTAGHIFHEWVQRITKQTGVSVAQETELQSEELMVRGHIDDLVLIPGHDPAPYGMPEDAPMSWGMPDEVPSKLILYDYKTVNSQAFKYKKERPMSYYHTMQLGTYMYMLKRLAKAELQRRKNGV